MNLNRHTRSKSLLVQSERRSQNERANKLLRKKQSAISGRKPARDPKYLAFIRMLPCVGCYPNLYRTGSMFEWIRAGTFATIRKSFCGNPFSDPTCDAAHIGSHALGQKASDYTAVPLGRQHHEQIGSSIRKLEALGIDYKALVKKLREAYDRH